MQDSYDVIVVGAGVIGGAIAYTLSKRGAKVLVLEKDHLASKASSAAAGMLAAQAELDGEGPLFPLAKKSRSMFPKLALEIKEVSGIDMELVNKGMLKVALNEQQKNDFQRIVTMQQDSGEQAEWLSGEEVKEKEPTLSEDVLGGMYLEKDGQLEARQLTLGFLKSATALGALIKENVEVKSFTYKNGKVTGVATNEGTFVSDKVIVACGAWSSQLLSNTGLSLDTYPVKGECFSVITHRPLLSSTVFSEGCYLVPKKGGRLVVGATIKPNTFNQQVTLGGISTLMDKAKILMPQIVEAEWERAWSSIRPQTVDGLPYLGHHPEYAGLLIATGHYRNGILLSPITGEVIADLVEGITPSVDITPFRVERLVKQLHESGAGTCN
ncbi:glycine oxidase ThiO [Radiobacillus kanasensis]|uniref:glycine oxidase ThiO n=1 Tax=Radiobacillus kanasensis TaxID=2844358 RepID=UPI001E576100|nr:glycine oxidase ThiO [Radiobacillus kanasensis]UFT98555.1 glycine oxidase ThiO [Radiobacillus kanasensis]